MRAIVEPYLGVLQLRVLYEPPRLSEWNERYVPGLLHSDSGVAIRETRRAQLVPSLLWAHHSWVRISHERAQYTPLIDLTSYMQKESRWAGKIDARKQWRWDNPSEDSREKQKTRRFGQEVAQAAWAEWIKATEARLQQLTCRAVFITRLRSKASWWWFQHGPLLSCPSRVHDASRQDRELIRFLVVRGHLRTSQWRTPNWRGKGRVVLRGRWRYQWWSHDFWHRLTRQQS